MLVSFIVIGRNIRQAHKQKRMTQENVANALDISSLHYGRLERGQRPVSLNQLAEIAKLFDVSLDDLLCGSSECFRGTPSKGDASFGAAMASITAGCSQEAHNLIIEVCQAIAKHDNYHDL